MRNKKENKNEKETQEILEKKQSKFGITDFEEDLLLITKQIEKEEQQSLNSDLLAENTIDIKEKILQQIENEEDNTFHNTDGISAGELETISAEVFPTDTLNINEFDKKDIQENIDLEITQKLNDTEDLVNDNNELNNKNNDSLENITQEVKENKETQNEEVTNEEKNKKTLEKETSNNVNNEEKDDDLEKTINISRPKDEDKELQEKTERIKSTIKAEDLVLNMETETVSDEQVKNYVKEHAGRIGHNFNIHEDQEELKKDKQRFAKELADEKNKKKRKRKKIAITIIAILLVVGGYFGYTLYQYNTLRSELNNFPKIDKSLPIYEVADKAPLTNKQAKGTYGNKVVGYIEIPAVKIKVPLIQSTEKTNPEKALSGGVVHDFTTPLPGEMGNSVIAGHREGDFSRLEYVQQNDLIIVTIGKNSYLYEVTKLESLGTNKKAIDKIFKQSADSEDLTLYTCYPFGRFTQVNGRWQVKAKRIAEYDKDITARVS